MKRDIDHDIEQGLPYFARTQCDHCKQWVLVQFSSGWALCPKCGYKIME